MTMQVYRKERAQWSAERNDLYSTQHELERGLELLARDLPAIIVRNDDM